jgi:hypothetical protein
MEQIRADLRAIRDDVAEIRKTVCGTAADPAKGLIVRVDRLEQTDKRRTWWTRSAVGASIASLVAVVMKILEHR